MKTTFGYRVHPLIENQNSHGRTHGRRKKTTATGHMRACGRLREIDLRARKASHYQAIKHMITLV